MLDSYISTLCRYAERTGLLQPEDLVFARNALLEALQLDSFDEAAAPAEASLADILQVLTGDAVARGVCPDNQVARVKNVPSTRTAKRNTVWRNARR